MTTAVDARDLTRRFGKFTAVDRVSFRIEEGEIYGFLGPNGAGKSTTIRMLCGILAPTEGEATVAGYDIRSQPDLLKEHIGYMSQQFSLYGDLTVEQNIDFYAGIYRIPRRRRSLRTAWVLEMAGLVGKEQVMAADLSGGWKQRLSLGCSVLHEPKILFLDEPTAGVDPISRRAFWDLIYRFSREGVTVFVTTHYMDEAEHCHRLALIYDGRLISEATPADFKRQVVTVQIVRVHCRPLRSGKEVAAGMDGVSAASMFGDSLHVLTPDADRLLERLPESFAAAGVDLDSAARIEPTLEDAFIALIERADREDGRG